MNTSSSLCLSFSPKMCLIFLGCHSAVGVCVIISHPFCPLFSLPFPSSPRVAGPPPDPQSRLFPPYIPPSARFSHIWSRCSFNMRGECRGHFPRGAPAVYAASDYTTSHPAPLRVMTRQFPGNTISELGPSAIKCCARCCLIHN